MAITKPNTETKKTKEKDEGMSDEDFAASLESLLEAKPELANPKRGVIVKNMTPSEYKEYLKKFPDGQENVEINIIAETKAKGGLMRKEKGGLLQRE